MKINVGVSPFGITSNTQWENVMTKVCYNLKLDFEFSFHFLDRKSPDIDLVIFDGGADVSPSYYNEEVHIATMTRPERDKVEKDIFNHYRTKCFMFGICRGSQFLNVMLGGTLYQHLADLKLSHPGVHKVNVDLDTELYHLLQTKVLTVNSTHHQAVRNINPQSYITLRCTKTNVIEGFETFDGNIRAVQSHPEYSHADFYTKRLEMLSYLFFLDEFGNRN
jgi:gamma-glutamyl-gamma-aminobutyrate hydrolase PuuD